MFFNRHMLRSKRETRSASPPRIRVSVAKAIMVLGAMAAVWACAPEAREPSVGLGGQGGSATGDMDASVPLQGGAGGGGAAGRMGGSGGAQAGAGGNVPQQGGQDAAGDGGGSLPDAGMQSPPDAPAAKLDTMVMAPLVLDVVADAHTRDGIHANTNHGSAQELGVKNSILDFARNGFLKFSIASLQGRAVVSSAKLRLMVEKGTQDQAVELQVRALADDSWNESTITWANQPMGGEILASAPVSVMTYTLMEFDVTAYVRNAQQAQKSDLSFALTGTYVGEVQLKIASRENGTLKGAQLVVSP